MKIMYDATSLARKRTGIENYTRNLMRALINRISSTDELYILFRKEITDMDGISLPKNVKLIISPLDSQILCEQVWIPYIKTKYNPDVIHFPAFPPSFFIKKNTYITVHDATMWKFPETLSFKNKLYMRPLTTRGIKIAEKILTVSESSRSEIGDVFPKYKDKIFNTGISISNEIKPIINNTINENTRKKYNLPEKFILTVGSIEPRKNLRFLIETFTTYCNENKNNEVKLIITGRAAWGAKDINSFIKNNNMENKIIMTGYVSDEELTSLYTLCDFFVYPSIYEGFGLPVLEAMACGAAVVVSNTSSLPEVAGENALYFNPNSTDELIKNIEYVIENPEVKNNLETKSLIRSKEFSWGNVVDSVYSIYKT